MSFRSLISFALILVFAAACRLKPIEEAAVITEAPTFTQDAPANTNTPAPTITVQATFTVQPTRQIVATAIAPNCVPTHAEWPVYTVRSGDTLGNIASRTGTTADTLVTVNCIANANLITVGMNLRVPRLPSTPTPTTAIPTSTAMPANLPVVGGTGSVPIDGCWLVRGNGAETVYIYNHASAGEQPIAILGTYLPFLGASNFGIMVVDIPQLGRSGEIPPNLNSTLQGSCPPEPVQQCLVPDNGTAPVNGMLVISPSTFQSATCVSVQVGTVTVSWPQAPANAVSVEFWTATAYGLTDVIGVDNNLADGASIQWEIRANDTPKLIYAIPYVTGGANWSGQISVYIGQ